MVSGSARAALESKKRKVDSIQTDFTQAFDSLQGELSSFSHHLKRDSFTLSEAKRPSRMKDTGRAKASEVTRE